MSDRKEGAQHQQNKHPNVQSVIFDKKVWQNAKSCKVYLKEHGYKYGDTHITDKHYRFRQYDPNAGGAPASYRTVHVQPGVKYIIGVKIA